MIPPRRWDNLLMPSGEPSATPSEKYFSVVAACRRRLSLVYQYLFHTPTVLLTSITFRDVD
tara:strand:- start:1145 stop:1327 length:183 start_codon:yes stop_codon:yes gene_type:complete